MSQCSITCRTCGNTYLLPAGEALRECAACGTVNERPQATGEALEKLQRANRLRLQGEFSEALKCYEIVLVEYDDEHEALWGKLLCQYGVEFVADPKTGVRHATVHIPRSRPMQLHADYARACEMAPEQIRAQYEAEAAYVDAALAEIRRRTETEPPYDVFICHKTTPLSGEGYTEDYNRGMKLARRIEKAGYSVFFAPFADLAPGASYEAGIYHALSTAKVMLLIASDVAHLTSPWVKSEWSRYLEMLDDGADKHLIPLMYGSLSDARMPKEIRLRGLQSIRMEDFDAAEKVMAALLQYTGKAAVQVASVPEPVPQPAAAPAPQPTPAPQPAAETAQPRPAPVPVQPKPAATPAPQPAGEEPAPSRPASVYTPESHFATAAVEGGVTITKYTGPGGEVRIPPTIGGKTVVEIGEKAFEEKSPTKVVIPEGVVSIGSLAFSGCANLHAVELPERLRTIGWGAFKRCASLAVVTLPEGVSEIAAAAFSYCTSLKTIRIPASVTAMEWNPFDCCSSLQTIDVAPGNPMYYIHNHALISRSGVLIGYPIGREPEQFIVPPGVTIIGGWSFQRSRITGVTIPEGVQCIGDAAFDNSPRLESVHIPGSVLEVRTNPFNGCNAMKEITVAPGSMMYYANGNVLFSRVGVLVCYPSGLKDERYDVPAGTKSIGAWAMRNNTALKTIGIPESVTELGSNALPHTTTFTLRVQENSPAHAYAQRNNLRTELIPAAAARPRPASAPRSAEPVPDYEREWSFQTEDVAGGVSITKYTGENRCVRIPPMIDGKKVVGIGERAFYEKSLVEVFIPDGVKSIGDYAFSGTFLANITIPDGVTTIGANPFKGCHSLTDITVPPAHPILEVVEGVLFDKKAKKLIYYPCKLKNSYYAVPHGTLIIGASAFSHCSYSLTEIHLPASVTTIGEYAFSYCGYLRDINLPEGVTSIGDYAFFWCKSMTTLTIPNNVVSIGESVFKGCEALTLRVCADSYAHKYARAKGLKFELITTDHAQSTTTEKSASSLFSRLFGKK